MIHEAFKEYGEIIFAMLSLVFFIGLIIWSCRKKPITEHKEVGYEAADIKVKRDDK